MPLEFSSRVDKVNVSGRSPEIAPSLPSPSALFNRIIDVTLSNCINSSLRRVFVLTQYKASVLIATFAPAGLR